jgi:small GTP-binding protein
MIQKKICMVGAFAVGKTSLVSRYVKSIFSDKYLTTVGVKIDKKEMAIDGNEINLILWDLAGEDEFMQLQTSYLRGSSGYILVADGTRASTVVKAFSIQRRVEDAIGKVPFVLVVNKLDLKDQWEVEDAAVQTPRQEGWPVIYTSAKTGAGVEELFETLARKILQP